MLWFWVKKVLSFVLPIAVDEARKRLCKCRPDHSEWCTSKGCVGGTLLKKAGDEVGKVLKK